MGYVHYQGAYLSSETARRDEIRRQTGIPYPIYMKQRLESTYGYVVGGLGITAASAFVALRTGAAYRIASLGMLGSLVVCGVCGIAPMMICMSMDENQNGNGAKQAMWAVSTAGMGLMISPVGFFGGQILLRAAVGTGLMVGALSSVAMTAPSESFLWMAAPLNMGLGLVVLSSFGTFIFPAQPILQNIALYGGLGVFGAFILYDTQKIQHSAQHKQVYSPINESFKLYLDIVNIFVDLARILYLQQGGGKRR